MEIELKINDKKKKITIEPGDLLLDILRREGYFSVKRGCSEGECGACTVLLDGRPINSCIMFAAMANGRSITTVEALGTVDKLHPIQEAYVEEGAIQCGYCIPGSILATKALLDRNDDPSEADARAALDSHLCRCTGYVNRLKAVLSAAKKLRKVKK
jgi:aerobic-type carbon monoxide dehydrogenase small subunit (CoxS/CutS family)